MKQINNKVIKNNLFKGKFKVQLMPMKRQDKLSCAQTAIK